MDYEHEYKHLDEMSAMTDRRVKRNTLSLSEEFGAMEKKEETGAHFQTTFGLVLSCMGCVVGTGNIWRFPRIVAQNSSEEGGLVFLLVWLLFLFLWSSPLLMLEYGTGRYTKKAILGSLRQFLGDNHIWCGAWISLVTFAISCYYSVVLGWCFYYLVYYIGHELPSDDEKSKEIFHEFAEVSYWPILTHFCAVFLAAVGVSRGVKTIEKVSMVLVPLLLLILLFTFIWSLTREYTEKGLKFLFTPHWETFKEPRLWVDAASQNAFDTGAGMGLMIPYSAYMTRRNGIVKYANIVPAANNFVSLLCGMTIFGTTFSTLMTGQMPRNETEIITIMKESGPASTGLTFIWMPVLFETIGSVGRVITVLFFLCLSFAGVTSLMSNFELTTKTFEDFGLKRRYGMPLAVILTFSVGLASALDINVLTNQDFVWGFALIVSGLILMYMVLKYGIRTFRETVVNNYSENDWKLTIVWEIIIKFITPIEAIALIVWWAVDLITNDSGDGEEWYTFGKETLIMTLTQWLSMMLILIVLNIIYVKCRRKPIVYEEFRNHEKTPLLLSQSGDGDLSRDLDGSFKELRL